MTKSQKYPSFSPYTFGGDDPIIIIDRSGQKIVVYTEDKEFNTAKTILEKHFDKKVEFSLNEKRELVMNIAGAADAEKEQNLNSILANSKTAELYKTLSKGIDDAKTVNVALVDHSRGVAIANFGRTQTIDIGDIADIDKFAPNNKLLTSIAALGHELTEAITAQTEAGTVIEKGGKLEATNWDIHSSNGKKIYEKAHNEALRVQAAITGQDQVTNDKTGLPPNQGVNVTGTKDGITKDEQIDMQNGNVQQ